MMTFSSSTRSGHLETRVNTLTFLPATLLLVFSIFWIQPGVQVQRRQSVQYICVSPPGCRVWSGPREAEKICSTLAHTDEELKKNSEQKLEGQHFYIFSFQVLYYFFSIVSVIFDTVSFCFQASQVVLKVKKLPANAEDTRDIGSIPGHGYPLQYSCLENSHGQRSLVGYSPWGRTMSDMTKTT